MITVLKAFLEIVFKDYKNLFYSIKNSNSSRFFNRYYQMSTKLNSKLNYNNKDDWWKLYDNFVLEPHNNGLFYIYHNHECK